MKLQVIDDFLGAAQFAELRGNLTDSAWPWYYMDGVTYSDRKDAVDSDRSQFCYTMYSGYTYSGAGQMLVSPFLKRLDPIALIRVKANLQIKTSSVLQNSVHKDYDIETLLNSGEREVISRGETWTPLKDVVTGIYYVNTNNGETRFEDGTSVKSVANRMILFPGDTFHSGTTCSDEKRRMVINFNYIPRIYPLELVETPSNQ
jgi:hypothetical protein